MALLHKKYLLYGSSIVVARGLEYLILFFAASFLTKENYGGLEYYKKLLEVVSSIFAFGFPALIISYTKSDNSKKYFFTLAAGIVLIIGGIASIFFSFFNLGFLVLPLLFYALFFNGGIVPAYFLVRKGSKVASYYKIIISLLFYALLFILLYLYDVKGSLYPIGGALLFPVSLIYVIYIIYKERLELQKLKKYWTLFKKLLMSSFTLVVGNFANLMFLYTDIFIIEILSKNSKIEIAEYSFLLNICNILLLIPLTLVQVDIEKIKSEKGYVSILNRKITSLVVFASLVIFIIYIYIISKYFPEYSGFYTLFIILLLAKIIQSLSPLFGYLTIVKRMFRQNLLVNIFTLILNILLGYILYHIIFLEGLAIASLITLIIRYIFLRVLVFKSKD